jgi:hypothetical protein
MTAASGGMCFVWAGCCYNIQSSATNFFTSSHNNSHIKKKTNIYCPPENVMSLMYLSATLPLPPPPAELSGAMAMTECLGCQDSAISGLRQSMDASTSPCAVSHCHRNSTYITTTSELGKVYNINGAPQQWNEMRAALTISKVFPSAATAMCWPSPLNARQRTGELQNTIHRWKINFRQLQCPNWKSDYDK